MPLLFLRERILEETIMELTPRLRAIAEMVPAGASFADIGTDHAYLPTWLLLNGIIDRAIAADIREGPLERAKETARKYLVDDKMDFRLCDGLTAVREGEANAIAIAGMGGDTIAHILSQASWTKNPDVMLFLQPMTSQPDLRQWLYSNGYRIESERVVREGNKLYIILCVKTGQMDEMTTAELWAGSQSDDPLRGEFLDHIAGKVIKMLDGQRVAVHPDTDTMEKLSAVLDDLNAMKEEWNEWQQ